MIFIEHHNELITTGPYSDLSVIDGLKQCAREHPTEAIVIYKMGIDVTNFIATLKNQDSQLYFSSSHNTLSNDLGYVEDSPFLKIAKNVIYPTWIKSTDVVYLHARLINAVGDQIPQKFGYLYWLNSLGKLSQPQGIFNYQQPIQETREQFTNTQLYRFVKQHYKARWTLLLLICHIIYERRIPLYAFVKAQLHPRLILNLKIESLQEKCVPKKEKSYVYEVVIPTMGRAAYLKNVLYDFKKQTLLPKKVIIVEQHPDPAATTELSYLEQEDWPFSIDHIFIHQTGACNARNLALSKTTAEWIMLFDDDARFDIDTFSNIFDAIKFTSSKVINTAYLQENEIENDKAYRQWKTFGSGCAMVHRDVIAKCTFDLALEHGYGEDSDYGMQIRNAGYDIIYAPQIQIKHLKAPVGGFRNPHRFIWQEKNVSPKPSPQVMYFRRKHSTPQQLNGYKLVLFLKFYKSQSIKNPLAYYRYFRKAWASSLLWSKKIPLDD